jgi:hypothetical protein
MDNDSNTAVSLASVDAVGNRSASRSSAPAADRNISPWPVATDRKSACPVAVMSSGVGWLIILWGGSHPRV